MKWGVADREPDNAPSIYGSRAPTKVSRSVADLETFDVKGWLHPFSAYALTLKHTRERPRISVSYCGSADADA
jgi:hypothetical protein